MEYKIIGKTGVKVSTLCLGTMHFGGKTDEEMAQKMFNRARKEGINIFDTANVYNDGESEKVLGQCMRGCRDDIIIISKAGEFLDSGINSSGLSKRHIEQEIDKSLRRLNTDYIDIYFAHRFDYSTPIKESLNALNSLVEKGKVLYLGVSNWAAWQIEKSIGISESKNIARIECVQPMYNLLKRQVEVEILPMSERENLGVISYNPLAGGLLTGKYTDGRTDVKGRLTESEQYQNWYSKEEYYEITKKFVKHARKNKVEPAALAVAWVSSHPSITAPLIGAKNIDQLEGYLNSLNINMTKEWREKINNLTITPPPFHDRLGE